MKKIKWSAVKTIKLIAMIFIIAIFTIGYIYAGIFNIFFGFSKWILAIGGLGGLTVIISYLFDIFKSEAKEKEEKRAWLSNQIKYHEKSIEELKSQLNKIN